MMQSQSDREARSADFEEMDFLYPKTDADIDSVQRSMLEMALAENNRAQNIAITGPLGSGKSTLIRSFERSRRDGNAEKRPFAYVSLAEFETENHTKAFRAQQSNSQPDSRPENSEQNANVSVIEEKIISQLAASPNAGKKFRARVNPTEKMMHRSRFAAFPSAKSIINKRLLRYALVGAVFVVAAVIAAAGITYRGGGSAPDYLFPVLSLAIVATALCGIYAAWKSGLPSMFRSVGAGGAKLEFSEEIQQGTYFDKNLSFILLLFESRQENVYVFEDLDRLPHDDILVHLRELNGVLNKRFEGERIIKFVYCIGDTTIGSADRSKFFDLIVPVIPYADRYNSFGRLINQLGPLADDLAETFLRNISLHFPDYRAIKCTVNDYRVILHNLNSGEEHSWFDNNKLFALMAMKNVYAPLFTDLQRRSGKLYDLLSDGKKWPVDKDGRRMCADTDIDAAVTTYAKGTSIDIDKAKSLVRYLIQHRYLDMQFQFYLSYPDPYALSERDQAWVMGSNSGDAELGFSYSLDDPKKVAEYFDIDDYKNPSLLNESLILYFMNEPEHQEQFDVILDCILSHQTGEIAKEMNQLVTDIPEFPYRVLIHDKEAFNKLQDSLESPSISRFAISIISYSKGELNELRMLNEKNGDFFCQELRANSGLYETELLKPYAGSQGALQTAIVSCLASFDIFAERISADTDEKLIAALERESRYKMTPENLNVLADAIYDKRASANDLLDRICASGDSTAWENITENTNRFAREYLVDDQTISCAPGSFTTLLNSCDSLDTCDLLIRSYSGSPISDIDDIEMKKAWGAAYECAIVRKSGQNVLSGVKYLDCNGTSWHGWVQFTNSVEDLTFKSCEIDEPTKIAIQQKVLDCASLEEKQYKALVGVGILGFTLASLPGRISEERQRWLIVEGYVGLNANTLSAARDLLDDKELVDFEFNNIDDFEGCYNQVGYKDDFELAGIVERLGCDEESVRHAEYLANRLRGRIFVSDKFDDAIASVLLELRKIDTASLPQVINRYGRNQALDEQLRSWMESAELATFEGVEIPENLLCDSIPKCSSRQKTQLVGFAIKHQPKSLVPLLHSIDDSAINRVLAGKHPLIDDVSRDNLEVVDVLEAKGLISDENKEGRSRRLRLRPSKWKSLGVNI
jgi:hypothetical protein